MGSRKLTADIRRSDSPPYQPGQKVWLSTRDIRLRLPCKKLAPRYVGPFVIQKQINLVMFQLKLPPQYRIHPTFHVSLLKPYHSPVSPSTEPGPITELPLPLILEDGAVYEVRTILDSRRRGGRLEYLVDWEGYGPEERSWILISLLDGSPWEILVRRDLLSQAEGMILYPCPELWKLWVWPLRGRNS